MEKEKAIGLITLIGNPVKHSVSPNMFNRVFEHEGLLRYLYIALNVERGELPSFIKLFKTSNIVGANVTIPHKVEVMKYLDKLHTSAREVEAVNTIKKEKGDKLTGYNTDMLAIIKVLEKNNPTRRKAIIFGCGGAAKAAAVALKKLGYREQVYVGRSRERINGMKRFLIRKRIRGRVVKIGSEEVEEELGASDLVINATPVGMYPNVNESVVDSSKVGEGSIVFDMVYNPPETLFLKKAKEAGAVTIGGLDMLVLQAVEAYKIWFGKYPPAGVMKRAAEEALKEFR